MQLQQKMRIGTVYDDESTATDSKRCLKKPGMHAATLRAFMGFGGPGIVAMGFFWRV